METTYTDVFFFCNLIANFVSHQSTLQNLNKNTMLDSDVDCNMEKCCIQFSQKTSTLIRCCLLAGNVAMISKMLKPKFNPQKQTCFWSLSTNAQ
jgi:hypothetical protein